MLPEPRARRLTKAEPSPPFESFSVAALPTKEGNWRRPSAGGVGALLLQDGRGVNRYRQGRFGFRSRDVGTGHDDASVVAVRQLRAGARSSVGAASLLRKSARGDEERNSEADCESRAERS